MLFFQWDEYMAVPFHRHTAYLSGSVLADHSALADHSTQLSATVHFLHQNKQTEIGAIEESWKFQDNADVSGTYLFPLFKSLCKAEIQYQPTQRSYSTASLTFSHAKWHPFWLPITVLWDLALASTHTHMSCASMMPSKREPVAPRSFQTAKVSPSLLSLRRVS